MPTAVGPTRADTWTINVWLDVPNTPNDMSNLGVWDKKSGGEVDSEETKYKPGGMVAPISLGGSQNIGNVTLSRLYRIDRDHQNLAHHLIAGAGKYRVKISQTPMDIDGNTYTNGIVYAGLLKRVTFPEVDSEGTDAALVEIECTIEGAPVVINPPGSLV